MLEQAQKLRNENLELRNQVTKSRDTLSALNTTAPTLFSPIADKLWNDGE
jgi:hypothetical protein